MNFYQFIIPRLNGKDIEKNFDYYHRLVKKGIAGFIVFGGRLETVRQGISELQKASKNPLIIASDLEQGLGQHIEGGTIFPPAMAIASAIKKSYKLQVTSYKLKLLRDAFKAIALEARHAGINTIFAPVLDINTNPKNPIISTRAFGEDAETVSFFGCEMIKILQANGISACGKHFPGHGDTEIDSHIKLPVIKRDLKSLEKVELVPFKNAIRGGLKMIMLGHLKVPALDPSGIPASLSEKVVRCLRDKMRFKGILITDALNMHALTQNVTARSPEKVGTTWQSKSEIASPMARNDNRGVEEKASLLALKAGVDLLLHPTDPDRIASYLESVDARCKIQDARNIRLWKNRVSEIQKKNRLISIPQFEKHRELSEELTRRAIRITGQIKPIKKPFLIILNDDADTPGAREMGEDVSPCGKGGVFAEKLKEKFPDLGLQIVNRSSKIQKLTPPYKAFVIVAIFSETKAWKGGPGPWLMGAMKRLEKKANVFISFGSPYLLDGIRNNVAKIYAYWDSAIVQRAVAELI